MGAATALNALSDFLVLPRLGTRLNFRHLTALGLLTIYSS